MLISWNTKKHNWPSSHVEFPNEIKITSNVAVCAKNQ